ncbi:MAG: peptidoglycan editing factor PgeF [Clostridia bacterium]|nr:peptidoglycan editing factor PgeF [Clostridia bacterium]
MLDFKDLKQFEHGDTVYFADPDIAVPHGFSTRKGGVSTPPHLASMNLGWNLDDDPDSVRENYRRICQATKTPQSGLVYTKQIHSAVVEYVTEADRGKTFECDGLVTDRPGVTLSIRTADCVPILFWAPVDDKGSGEPMPDGVVGACHAGWRGTVARIQQNTVGRMVALGADVGDIRCAVGAAIHSCCYEVGGDFRDAVADALGEEMTSRFVYEENGALRADLIAMNVALLLECGIPASHISVSSRCTCCESELFFSHRASKGKRGVMAALISL